MGNSESGGYSLREGRELEEPCRAQIGARGCCWDWRWGLQTLRGQFWRVTKLSTKIQ